MADTKVTDEAAATALDGTEFVRIVQGGSSKKTTLEVAGHQFRGAKAKMTADDTAQNYTTAAAIPAFDAAPLDTDGFWSAGTPGRLTIPAGLGITVVALTGQVHASSTTASTWAVVSIQHLNSSNVVQATYSQLALDKGSTSVVLNVSTGPVVVADGDYFTLRYQEESDNSVTIEGDSTTETFLSLEVKNMDPV